MYRGHLMNCEDGGGFLLCLVSLKSFKIRGGTWQLYSSMSLAVSFHAFVSLLAMDVQLPPLPEKTPRSNLGSVPSGHQTRLDHSNIC